MYLRTERVEAQYIEYIKMLKQTNYYYREELYI